MVLNAARLCNYAVKPTIESAEEPKNDDLDFDSGRCAGGVLRGNPPVHEMAVQLSALTIEFEARVRDLIVLFHIGKIPPDNSQHFVNHYKSIRENDAHCNENARYRPPQRGDDFDCVRLVTVKRWSFFQLLGKDHGANHRFSRGSYARLVGNFWTDNFGGPSHVIRPTLGEPANHLVIFAGSKRRRRDLYAIEEAPVAGRQTSQGRQVELAGRSIRRGAGHEI